MIFFNKFSIKMLHLHFICNADTHLRLNGVDFVIRMRPGNVLRGVSCPYVFNLFIFRSTKSCAKTDCFPGFCYIVILFLCYKCYFATMIHISLIVLTLSAC